MGLDIFHRKATMPTKPVCDGSESYTSVTEEGEKAPGEEALIAKFKDFLTKVENTYVDMPETLAKMGFGEAAMEHFNIVGAAYGPTTRFSLARLPGAPVELPESFEVSEESFVTKQRFDDVILYDEVGYQRKGVTDEFYDKYPGWCFLTTLEEVKEMLTYVADDYKGHFKENFVDNWDEETSFVVVWW